MKKKLTALTSFLLLAVSFGAITMQQKITVPPLRRSSNRIGSFYQQLIHENNSNFKKWVPEALFVIEAWDKLVQEKYCLREDCFFFNHQVYLAQDLFIQNIALHCLLPQQIALANHLRDLLSRVHDEASETLFYADLKIPLYDE